MKFKPIVKIKAPLPDVLNENLDSYEDKRVDKNDHIYLVDKKEVYIESLLTLKQADFDESLEWVLWVKIPVDNQLGRYLKSPVLAPTDKVRILQGGQYEILSNGIWKQF